MSSTIRFSADGSRKDGRGNNFFIIEKEIFQLKDLQSFDFKDFRLYRLSTLRTFDFMDFRL